MIAQWEVVAVGVSSTSLPAFALHRSHPRRRRLVATEERILRTRPVKQTTAQVRHSDINWRQSSAFESTAMHHLHPTAKLS